MAIDRDGGIGLLLGQHVVDRARAPRRAPAHRDPSRARPARSPPRSAAHCAGARGHVERRRRAAGPCRGSATHGRARGSSDGAAISRRDRTAPAATSRGDGATSEASTRIPAHATSVPAEVVAAMRARPQHCTRSSRHDRRQRVGEAVGRADRHRLELPRRHGRGRDALSRRRHRRSAHARHPALGHRLPVRAAGRAAAARALAARARLAGRRAASGFCFFGLFFVFYNLAVSYTTAARASLALSTLPLQTMIVGALLGIEALTARKAAACDRHARRLRGARLGSGEGAGGRLARRADHGRRRAVHGVLQRLVAALHPALERARLPRRRHGRGAAALVVVGAC